MDKKLLILPAALLLVGCNGNATPNTNVIIPQGAEVVEEQSKKEEKSKKVVDGFEALLTADMVISGSESLNMNFIMPSTVGNMSMVGSVSCDYTIAIFESKLGKLGEFEIPSAYLGLNKLNLNFTVAMPNMPALSINLNNSKLDLYLDAANDRVYADISDASFKTLARTIIITMMGGQLPEDAFEEMYTSIVGSGLIFAKLSDLLDVFGEEALQINTNQFLPKENEEPEYTEIIKAILMNLGGRFYTGEEGLLGFALNVDQAQLGRMLGEELFPQGLVFTVGLLIEGKESEKFNLNKVEFKANASFNSGMPNMPIISLGLNTNMEFSFNDVSQYWKTAQEFEAFNVDIVENIGRIINGFGE